MSYYGETGSYTASPRYLHRDGSIADTPDPRGTIGFHDCCAEFAHDVDNTRDGWGSWHHSTGLSWAPWLAGVDCELCGKPC